MVRAVALLLAAHSNLDNALGLPTRHFCVLHCARTLALPLNFPVSNKETFRDCHGVPQFCIATSLKYDHGESVLQLLPVPNLAGVLMDAISSTIINRHCHEKNMQFKERQQLKTKMKH